MSAEDVLKENCNIYELDGFPAVMLDEAILASEQYAAQFKRDAIEFAEWCSLNDYVFYSEVSVWLNHSNNKEIVSVDLYQLFLTSKTK